MAASYNLSSLDALRHLFKPGVQRIMERMTRPGCRTPPWEIAVDYMNDNVIFTAFGKVMTLVNRYEIDDKSWKTRAIPRFEHWLSKNWPRQHERYIAKAAIKRPRHPSKEQ